MNMKATALFVALLTATVLAAALPCELGSYGDKLSAGEGYFANGEYREAGDCYREAESWDKCIVSYLKAGRISEAEWDLNQGAFYAGSEARTFYDTTFYVSSGLGSDMGKCLNGYGDATLTAEIKSYHSWMELYVVNGGDAPFDMESKVNSLETASFPPEPDPEPDPVPDIQPDTTDSDVGDTEEPAADLTPIIAAGVLIVLIIVFGAIFLSKKKKK